jgi:thiamine pyrophosphokinase
VGPPTAIVLAGGDDTPLDPAQLPSPATVIAADSGYDAAKALGLVVDLIVGDLDSISAEGLAAARAAGIAIEEYPADKDATDLELALQAAVALRPAEIVVVGGNGGRLDHLLGNALLLGAGFLGDITVRWEGAAVTTHRLTPGASCEVDGSSRDVVSLLPVAGAATGVTTVGLRWRLHGETLAFGSTRGISNELVGDRATIAIASGVLLVIHERGARW